MAMNTCGRCGHCRKDQFNWAHFEAKQLNHIVWTNTEELRERLISRIRGTVGDGPRRFEETDAT